jgi:iron complex transport system ATP-binding protein
MRIERELVADVDAPALVASGITVEAGRRAIVNAVSLQIAAGSWTCVIGPNGAGKTTLVHALAGLVHATGEVELWGRPIADLTRRERARAIALVPQLPTIPEGVTVEHYVMLGRTPHLGLLGAGSRHDHDVAADAMARLDLGWARDRRLETLSGGELRRAVLARALAQEAPLVLLDEPTTGLDLGQQLRVLELVDTLRREHGLTVLSTMHDLTLAGRFADRFVLMSGGRAVASGTREEVLSTHVIAEHYGAAVRIVDDGELGWAVVPISERER